MNFVFSCCGTWCWPYYDPHRAHTKGEAAVSSPWNLSSPIPDISCRACSRADTSVRMGSRIFCSSNVHMLNPFLSIFLWQHHLLSWWHWQLCKPAFLICTLIPVTDLNLWVSTGGWKSWAGWVRIPKLLPCRVVMPVSYTSGVVVGPGAQAQGCKCWGAPGCGRGGTWVRHAAVGNYPALGWCQLLIQVNRLLTWQLQSYV